MKLFNKSVSYLVDLEEKNLIETLRSWNDSPTRRNLKLNTFFIKKMKSENEVIITIEKIPVELYYLSDLKTLEIILYKNDLLISYLIQFLILGGYGILAGNSGYYFISALTFSCLVFIILISNSNRNQAFIDTRQLVNLMFFYQKKRIEEF